MLTFDYPWLFLLLPLPLLVQRLAPAYREPKLAVKVPFIDRLRRVGGRREGTETLTRRLRLQWLQLILVWVGVVAALARPLWLGEPIVRELPARDLLVALDLSGSMETRDFTDQTGAVSDRLSAAKQVLDEFLSRRDGDRVGLVLFGSAAYVQAPFTDDLDVVRELLDEAQVRMLGPRTVLGDAIGLALPMFERSEVEERVLIALTDGNDTGSLLPPARAAEIARDEGVIIYTIAMGDPEAADEQALDEAALEAVAGITGGEFFHADDRDELEAIYARLDALTPRRVQSVSYRPESELFHWPLGLGLLISIAYFGYAEWRLRARARRPRPATEPAS